MNPPSRPRARATVITLALAGVTATAQAATPAQLLSGYAAQAGDHRASSAPVSPKYRNECGACHVPYPAGLLPAASWQRLMNAIQGDFDEDRVRIPR
jgi:cytochrome c5